MSKKFGDVGAFEANPNWEKLICREEILYSRSDDIRSPFSRDYTRVLHSLAYRRLKHKTQVFLNAAGNDHICTRIEHVMHVDSVSSTIAGALGLNEELTKAIAMSHDLGHAPFGHQGERILNDITKEYLGKSFWHEQNGVHLVDNVELLEDNQRQLKNLNLTYAVRDGIISHCGEVDENGIRPRTSLFDLKEFDAVGKYQAATWEGCVVKLADKIAYLGRDIEDAIRLGYLSKEQMNALLDMARVNNESALNTTVIMHNMIIDLCKNSTPYTGLCLSREMSEQLKDIKDFNYRYIYKNLRLEPFNEYAKLVINQIFQKLLGMYAGSDTINKLCRDDFDNRDFIKEFSNWLVQYCEGSFVGYEDVTSRCCNKKIYGDLSDEKQYIQAIIDFISGMTDVYAMRAFDELLMC